MELTTENIVKELLKSNHNDVCIDYEKLKEWRTMSPLSNVGNLVCDWHTLGERLNTRMKSNVSFYDFLYNFESRFLPKVGVARLYDMRPNNSHIQRVKYAYNLYCGNPTVFRPITTLEILDLLPCKVACLDPTMGWGGRAVGCAIYGIPEYIGIDSNVNLREPYSRLCEFLGSRSETKMTTLFMNALAVDYSELKYDLVVTSYPYYNIEKYSNYTTYKTKKQMNEEFYKPLTLEIYKNLLPKGHMALNVSPEIYTYIHSFMGDPFLIQPLLARNRNAVYRESIYIWRK
jgi:hypothetical protein